MERVRLFGKRKCTNDCDAGFGTSTSTFGAAKPAFGSTTTGGGGLFGASNTANTSTGGGFGGFGSGTASTPAFGASSTGTTGGGLFGSKPAFGAATTTPATGGGLFGSSSGTTGAFGSTNTATTGATGGIGFGGSTQLPMQGTATVAYQPYTEKEGTTAMTNHFQTITFMPAYKNFSLEVSFHMH